jgi:predicted ATP-dependent endonuclease of OLD family
MNIVKFSVTNYRSITQASKIPISGITVLIGKNNEGKSNMLKALNVSMEILRLHGSNRQTAFTNNLTRRRNGMSYDWYRDFPISLQSRKSNTQSIFRLEFELSNEEVVEFKKEIKSNLNGTLPIEIRIGKDFEPKIKVIKTGRGSKTLNAKSNKIAEYIAKKIVFNYIPAVRTDKEAMDVVDEMLSKELAILENEPEYKQALKVIKELQTPILSKLSTDIKDSLIEFIPNIKEVNIEIQERRRRFALRQQFDVMIDDGNKTNLEFKGDGVKSLAALGLLKNITLAKGTASLVAIEEPESHLHPGAIHILKDTIYELADSNQVIVSTHNPLFVNRNNIKGNIIIDSGKARSSKNIKEIRELIGVKASDNLLNASYVLVVEGEEDVVALNSLLPFLSEKLSKAMKNHYLVIDKLGGASNLVYKLSILKNALCTNHVLLDNDDAGRKAYEKVEKEINFKQKDCTFLICNGMTNSEFEDCLNKTIYTQKILDEFGVDIKVSEFRGNTKWSERMRKTFLSQGKNWNDNTESEVKHSVAESIESDLENALCIHKRSPIDALVKTLERMIEKIK